MRTAFLAPLLLLLVAVPRGAGAAGGSQLTSAPHFVVLGDRERIVLFADGPLIGAMADRHGDGTIEVTIPRVGLAPALADREFDDASSGGTGKTRVRLSAGSHGDVLVRIQPGTPAASVHAFASTKPSRVTIDLLQTAADAATSAATPDDGAKPASPAASHEHRKRGADARSEKKSEKRDSSTARTASPPSSPSSASSAGANQAPVAKADASRANPAPPTKPGAVQGGADAVAAAGTPTATSDAAGDVTASSDQTLVCRWRRSSGAAYCAADPKAAVYALDLDTATLAGQLDRGHVGAGVTPLAPRGAAEAYLDADLELLERARDGWLLPVVTSYEQALRSYPGFADAPRARANVALLYHALGFEPELERLSRDSDPLAAPFAAVLLADLRREKDPQRDVSALLDRASKAGGITACLAARVRSNVAADAGNSAAFPEAFATLAKVCPRTIVEDAATAWLRGRAMLLAGDAPRAASTLVALQPELALRERALLLADAARAYDAAGNASAARAVQERLASGALGRRPVRGAQMALAVRDAADGATAAVERRMADLSPEDAQESRDRADVIAVTEMIHQGNEIAALGLLSERKVDVRQLAPADQIKVAQSFRRIGLVDQAQRILQDVAASAQPGHLPDAYWEELGAEALARGDANGVLAVVEQWQSRSGGTPPGSLALKARARAAKGDARGANDTLTKELAAVDPALARDVAIDLAHELLSADPRLALGLARGALDAGGLPPLAADRQAAALRAIGEAAEALGDRPAAQDAYARLAREHGGDPAAAGAAYHAARLASAAPAGGVPPAAAPSPSADDDPLTRRVAAAGQLYAEVVASMSSGAKP
jgi:hypothetical protein